MLIDNLPCSRLYHRRDVEGSFRDRRFRKLADLGRSYDAARCTGYLDDDELGPAGRGSSDV